MTSMPTSPPRLALRPKEAADAIGVSRNHFDRCIGPELRWARVGRVKVVSIRELARWLDSNSARSVVEDLTGDRS